MKVDALLCSCNANELKMKGKPIKRSTGCYSSRRKSSSSISRKGQARGGGSWLGSVKKKLLLVKTPNKNIIIIHNNTSIASNDEDNRASSCVDPPKDHPTSQLQEEDPVLKAINPVHDLDHDAVDADIDVDADHCSLSQEPTTNITIVGDHQQQEKHTNSHVDVVAVVAEEKLTLAAEQVVDALSQGKDTVDDDKEAIAAAIRIQTAFRTHLARRALRALRSLVRLQAVVRGVVVRRQARMAMHCMRALLRLGDRVRTRNLLTT